MTMTLQAWRQALDAGQPIGTTFTSGSAILYYTYPDAPGGATRIALYRQETGGKTFIVSYPTDDWGFNRMVAILNQSGIFGDANQIQGTVA